MSDRHAPTPHGADSVPVLVVGAGGHARVCAEALIDSGFALAGCLSADGSSVPGLPMPVVGTDDQLEAVAERLGVRHVFIAVGDNQARERLQRRAEADGLLVVQAISRFAMVSPTAHLGRGVVVAAGAVVNAAAHVADGVILNTRCSIDHDCTVAPFAHVSVGVSTGGAVHVGQRALLGVGAAVLPGVSIGADAVVGAGAVVVGDVADGSTVVGVPARPRPR